MRARIDGEVCDLSDSAETGTAKETYHRSGG
ncbi:hypothetical protein ACNKHN_23450 [Shigella flexneri]